MVNGLHPLINDTQCQCIYEDNFKIKILRRKGEKINRDNKRITLFKYDIAIS